MSRPWPALLLALSATALAGVDGGVLPPEQLRVRASPDKVQLGEPFVVEVAVTHAKEQRWELVAPGDLGDFDFVGHQRSRKDGRDSSTTVFAVKLQAYALGQQTTPTFTFEVADPLGAGQLPAAGTKIEVVSSLPKDAQKTGANLYDVRAPEEVAVRSWRLLYALGAALAAAALAYALYRWLKRPKPVPAVPEKPPLPLHVRTTAALDALAAQNLPLKGRVKEFYFRLSEIVRAYLGELYGFEALECTTPELLAALSARSTPGLPAKELSDFAQHSDFVRYAKAQPGPDECRLALELAYRVVHATTAALPPAPTPSAPRPSAPRPKP